MADTKEQILAKLERIREYSSKLATQQFVVIEQSGRVGISFNTGQGETPLLEIKNLNLANQLAAAWNADFDTYKDTVDFAAMEAALAEEYKTALGSEDVEPEPGPE